MGLVDPETGAGTANSTELIGATSGVFQAGAAINVFIASWVCDKWGRKAGLIWCAILSLFGGALLVGARNIGMFIAGRVFAGAGSWGFLSVTPAYSAELAPPDLRGLMVGLNGINIALGYGLASYMGLAFYYTNDPVSQWRTPLGIALVWPIMMIVICFMVPESPRYAGSSRWVTFADRHPDTCLCTVAWRKPKPSLYGCISSNLTPITTSLRQNSIRCTNKQRWTAN
jgi:MFS family permease